MGISFVAIFVLLLFLGMLVTGIVLIVTSRGKGKGYPSCGACGYDLSGTIGEERRCPECGADFATAGILPPTSKRRTGMLVSGIVLVVVSLSCFSMGVLLPAITVARSSTAARQAVIQQQAAIAAAAQAADIQAWTDELAAHTAKRQELTARQAELEAGDTGLSSDDVAAEMAEIESAIALIDEEIDALRTKLDEAESPVAADPTDPVILNNGDQ